MPRTKRLDLAGVTQHVIQRGNDRQACFYCEADYTRYLQDLRDAASASGCRVHAYVLMTNHVHLLVTLDAIGSNPKGTEAINPPPAAARRPRTCMERLEDNWGQTTVFSH